MDEIICETKGNEQLGTYCVLVIFDKLDYGRTMYLESSKSKTNLPGSLN